MLIFRACRYTYCSFVLAVVNLISTIYFAISCNTYFTHQKVFRAGQIFKLTKVLNSVLQISVSFKIINHSNFLTKYFLVSSDKFNYRDIYLPGIIYIYKLSGDCPRWRVSVERMYKIFMIIALSKLFFFVMALKLFIA